MSKVLIIGASGLVGAQLVKALDTNYEGGEMVLASSRRDKAVEWRTAGRIAVSLDLNAPKSFAGALTGIDRRFMLAGYASDMLYSLFENSTKFSKREYSKVRLPLQREIFLENRKATFF